MLHVPHVGESALQHHHHHGTSKHGSHHHENMLMLSGKMNDEEFE